MQKTVAQKSAATATGAIMSLRNASLRISTIIDVRFARRPTTQKRVASLRWLKKTKRTKKKVARNARSLSMKKKK